MSSHMSRWCLEIDRTIKMIVVIWLFSQEKNVVNVASILKS